MYGAIRGGHDYGDDRGLAGRIEGDGPNLSGSGALPIDRHDKPRYSAGRIRKDHSGVSPATGGSAVMATPWR